jgi:tripeptidyl-peptidase-1
LNEVTCQVDGAEVQAIITSGGGFSQSYSTPSWQSSVVQTYFTKVQGTSKAPFIGYNSGGRGYPDISLLAHAYQIVVGGRVLIVDGTSASAPVFAGMLGLINSGLRAQGKSTVGWVNPALYQKASYYVKDITVGDNKCTADPDICCSEGFFAAPGWDPATGLGSVNYEYLSYSFLTPNATYPPSGSPTMAPTGAAYSVRPVFATTMLLLSSIVAMSMVWIV